MLTMPRCYLKRSAKTAGALVVAFIMVIGLIDTRTRYHNFNMVNNMQSSDIYPYSERGLRKGGGNRNIIRLHTYDTSTNKTEDALTLHQNHQYHSDKIDININNDEVSLSMGGYLPTDTDSLTLRFWDLANNSSRGASTKGIFTETNQLPNLWRPQRELLSRDDDRVLAQLIWAMEAANLSLLNEQKTKTIFLPDGFRWWSKTKWRSPHILQEEDCPGNPVILRKCAFSQSRDSMDALITVRDTIDYLVPSNVMRFFFILESPIYSYAVLKRSNDLMATFFRGSDVNTPYGKWVYHDPTVKFKDQEKDYAKGKSKMAAIFTSNCYPWNNRMGYVRELQKYIEVDVYGACGQNTCRRYNVTECFKMLKRDYRFYLSFENSNCRDYVTEKLFMNAFENDVIPIVLGAHPQDYQAICPEKSYVHVEDFSSPKELAEYMKHLAETPEEYNSYFRWKGTGKFVDTNFFCRVCAMVHYADLMPPPERKREYDWSIGTAQNKKKCLHFGAWYWKSKTNER